VRSCGHADHVHQRPSRRSDASTTGLEGERTRCESWPKPSAGTSAARASTPFRYTLMLEASVALCFLRFVVDRGALHLKDG
jgi:hypothetical protein